MFCTVWLLIFGDNSMIKVSANDSAEWRKLHGPWGALILRITTISIAADNGYGVGKWNEGKTPGGCNSLHGTQWSLKVHALCTNTCTPTVNETSRRYNWLYCSYWQIITVTTCTRTYKTHSYSNLHVVTVMASCSNTVLCSCVLSILLTTWAINSYIYRDRNNTLSKYKWCIV